MSDKDINVVINEVRAAHKSIDKEVHHGDALPFECKRCATTVVNLGNHYTVIKHKDAEAAIGAVWKMASVRVVLDRIEDHNMLRGQRDYLVIESDWPEYEPVKQALLARINGDIKGELKYVEGDNTLKLTVEECEQLKQDNTHVQYAALFGEDNGKYTEWVDDKGTYFTVPWGGSLQKGWKHIPNGAQVLTKEGKFFKWVNDFVFIMNGDSWEPTGYKDVADFFNHNWGKLKWQRQPTIYVDKTNADTLHANSKEDLLDTYWNALSEDQKRKALRDIMVALPVQQDHCPSDNLAVLYPHYHKDVSHLQTVDVYRVLELFGVTEHTIGHAIKKLLCAGVRGAKDSEKDVREAVDTLNRHLQMKAEDCNAK